MLERVVVERLCDDRRHAQPRNFGPEHTGVCTNVRVRRAKLGDVRVAEGVLRRAVRMTLGERAVVEEHRPGMHAQAPRRRAGDELWERVRSLAHGRLQADLAPARRIRPEEDRTVLEEAHLANRVVREDVARLVVGGGDSDAAETGAVLDVVEDRIQAFVSDVGGEEEDRAVHAVQLVLRR